MSLPEFSLRQLLQAGVHFGHQTHRWNPLMDKYIHSTKNGIHIVDLTQTVPMLHEALSTIEKVVSKGGSVLFVGTKRQARVPIAEAAERCAQHYVNHRWLGGTLTNWKTVSNSISRLKSIDQRIEEGVEGLTKKERLGMMRTQTKLQASLGGIREMENVPDLLFVIDVKKEALAVAEAIKLGVPVVAIVDTNCSPQGIQHIIPGNDDSTRAINFYCDLVARAAIQGMTIQLNRSGVDVGELAEGLTLEAGGTSDSKTVAKDKAKSRKPQKKVKSDGTAKPAVASKGEVGETAGNSEKSNASDSPQSSSDSKNNQVAAQDAAQTG